MKMALDSTAGAYTVRSCEPGRVQIRERTHTRSIVVTPDTLLEEWAPLCSSELRATHFAALTALAPEVVLLGTGDRQVFPDPQVFTSLMEKGIGFEVMDNAAACRTYNILVAEGRRAALALIIATG